MSTEQLFRSTRYRMLENGHILLWLVKDTCWALEFKAGGITMILPTLGMAIYLMWRSRGSMTELFHNIAVCIWIMANSVWMLGEFFEKETRPYAVVLFIIGLALLAVYYIFFFRREYALKEELPQV
ncbi:MAG: hypothetical protein KDC07_09245, partial [Chitinophagaceae bacterium]|nr:hypothetical protein [Chitinophagaceae bacterium]